MIRTPSLPKSTRASALLIVLWAAFGFGPLPAAAATTEPWIKVESPHFIVLTLAPESTARAWCLALEQFVQGLGEVIAMPESKLTKATVLLFRTDRELRPFKPLENGQPKAVVGFFVRGAETPFIALALDARQSSIRRTVLHETVHWYLSASDVKLPLWLSEGLADVYATFAVDGGDAVFGELQPNHLRELRRQRPIKVERTVNTTPGSLDYNEGLRAPVFYAEAWGLTHYLLFGPGTPGRDSVKEYVAALRTAATPKLALEQILGADCDEIARRLGAYIGAGTHPVHRFKLPLAGIEASLRSTAATAAEAQRAQDELLLAVRRRLATEAITRLRSER